MTLNTAVYVMTEEDPHEVFTKCRELLDAPDGVEIIDEPSRYGAPGERSLRHPGGQGLDAWLWMYYVPGEMLRPRDVCDEDCEPDCDRKYHDPPHWFRVSFDTAYSFHDEYGGCGTRHARLLFDLGGWLDERGVMWAWKNEFTGEIHVGDKYAHLKDLVDDGQRAMRWLKETVEPYIASMGFGPPTLVTTQQGGTDAA